MSSQAVGGPADPQEMVKGFNELSKEHLELRAQVSELLNKVHFLDLERASVTPPLMSVRASAALSPVPEDEPIQGPKTHRAKKKEEQQRPISAIAHLYRRIRQDSLCDYSSAPPPTISKKSAPSMTRSHTLCQGQHLIQLISSDGWCLCDIQQLKKQSCLKEIKPQINEPFVRCGVSSNSIDIPFSIMRATYQFLSRCDETTLRYLLFASHRLPLSEHGYRPNAVGLVNPSGSLYDDAFGWSIQLLIRSPKADDLGLGIIKYSKSDRYEIDRDLVDALGFLNETEVC